MPAEIIVFYAGSSDDGPVTVIHNLRPGISSIRRSGRGLGGRIAEIWQIEERSGS